MRKYENFIEGLSPSLELVKWTSLAFLIHWIAIRVLMLPLLIYYGLWAKDWNVLYRIAVVRRIKKDLKNGIDDVKRQTLLDIIQASNFYEMRFPKLVAKIRKMYNEHELNTEEK